MPITQSQFVEIAETLPVNMKVSLADYLLNSLDSSGEGVDIVWKIEAGRHLDDVKACGMEIIPIQKVFEEMGKRTQL